MCVGAVAPNREGTKRQEVGGVVFYRRSKEGSVGKEDSETSEGRLETLILA